MRNAAALALALTAIPTWLPVEPAVAERAGEEVAAARALFEANLRAIEARDRDAYLACYLDSEGLVRAGPEGLELGFASLAAGVGDGWPEVFEAQDLRLVPIAPGVVYGSYRYRVRFDGEEQRGISERLFVDTADGWRIAATTAFPALAGTPPPPRALVGATLIDGTGAEPIPDAVVVLRNGRVECAGQRSACPVEAGLETVDLRGRWIIPGLIDAHVHFSQTGWADGRPDFLDLRQQFPYEEAVASLRREPERLLRAFLCSGVTAVFDNGGYPWTWNLRQQAELATEAPHVAAAGPLLSPVDHWLNLPGERQFIYLSDTTATAAAVRYLHSRGSDAVKVWFIAAPERTPEELESLMLAAGREASRSGMRLIVHATSLREAKIALRAGARLLVHSVWDQEVDEEFIALARRAGALYCPTLTVVRGYLRLAQAVVDGEVPAVDDPNGCLDEATRDRIAASAEIGGDRITPEALARRTERTLERERIGSINLMRLVRAGVPAVAGTDAGNPLTLHGPSIYAELEAMHAAGMTTMEVLLAATRNGARAMGRERDLGSVEAGRIADLLVLDADPLESLANLRRVRYVMRGGVLRPIAELRAAVGTSSPAASASD